MWDKPHLLLRCANALYALAAVLLLYAVGYVVLHLPVFPLRTVAVEGELQHVTQAQVQLIVAKHLRGNFFTLDLEEARAAFEKLPWVRNVSVRRQWPDRLVVSVEEHRALARWGNIALVNSYGEFFQAASERELPVFYGPGTAVREVAERYAEYSAQLAPAGMKITQLSLTPRRAWQLATDRGLVLELGREDTAARLAKFARVYQAELSGLNVPLAYADLRYPNGFAVRKPAQAKNRNNTGKRGAA